MQETAVAPTSAPIRERSRWTRFLSWFRFSNISALYVLAVVIIVFSVWQPSLFPTYSTFAEVLNNNTVPALLSLALIFALSAGAFDLSIGYNFSLCSVTVAWLLGNTHFSVLVCILITLLVALCVGVLNGVVVVVLRIDSFISTLATGSVIEAVVILVSGNRSMVNGLQTPGFVEFTSLNWHQITIPVLYTLVVATALWFFLQHTAQGRFAYATGLGPEAARLAGIRTQRIKFASLLVSALLAGFAGIVATSLFESGLPTAGSNYLIPAFAAAFLGATQLKGGLFNAWGTLIAVLLLGTTSAGLALATTSLWVPYIFTGFVLILALWISGRQRRRWSRRPEPQSEGAPAPVATAGPLILDEQLQNTGNDLGSGAVPSPSGAAASGDRWRQTDPRPPQR
jgi:ribose transport system permease protein